MWAGSDQDCEESCGAQHDVHHSREASLCLTGERDTLGSVRSADAPTLLGSTSPQHNIESASPWQQLHALRHVDVVKMTC